MSEMLNYDPWSKVTSRNGIAGDELISMLQKSIRRGKEKNALIAAYEMNMTSPQFADKMWRRLLAISVEDVGFGNVHAPEVIWSLYKMRKSFPYPTGDQPTFFVYAVRYLCKCQKDRGSAEMAYMAQKRYEHGEVLEVPEYAFDMHTVKGREMGRGSEHFLLEASRVEPELDESWVRELHARYLAFNRMEATASDEDVVEAFVNMEW